MHTLTQSTVPALPHPLRLKRKRGEKRKKIEKRKKGEYQDLGSVASPSSSSHGGAGLDAFHNYAGSPAKTHKNKGL
jgi:hypothetical protein